MSFLPPIHFPTWIEEHRHLLKPPVGNAVVYEDTDFIIMVVGGPNARKDFHYNEGEEFFYQIEGEICLAVVDDGAYKEVPIREGEIFLLPPRIPHSPQRGANTVGLVIERKRQPNEQDGFMWFCENCGHQLYQEFVEVQDLVQQLPAVFERFYGNVKHRTCSQCASVMEKP